MEPHRQTLKCNVEATLQPAAFKLELILALMPKLLPFILVENINLYTGSFEDPRVNLDLQCHAHS